MAFHISTYDLPNIDCYADAYKYWEKIKPWRGHDTNERPLAGRNKKHMTIRIGRSDEVICQLHRTDVVTYWPDGRLELGCYSSVSTDMFARALTPSDITTMFNQEYPCVVVGSMGYWNGSSWVRNVNQIVYPIGNTMFMRQIEDVWQSVEVNGHKPPTFEVYKRDIKKANAALKKHNYSDFKAFMTVRLALNLTGDVSLDRRNPTGALAILDGGPVAWTSLKVCPTMMDRWGRIVSNDHSLSRVLDEMLLAVYRVEDCIVVTDVPYFTSLAEVKTMSRNRERFYWAR